MTHDEAFLQAVIEDPDGDTPRLVYADWLEEHGDPRGEFIRVQMESSRLALGDDRLAALRRREDELLSRHRREWLGPLHSLAYRWDFKRGFAEEACLPAKEFLHSVDLLFRTTPLRLVRLLSSGPWVKDLAACPQLKRLKSLHMTNNQIGDKGLRDLIASPYLGSITSLRLGDAWLTEAAGLALADARHLFHLKTLNLSDNLIGDHGARAIASAPHFRGLTKLSLGNNQITDFGAQALADSPHLSQLRTLDLSNVSKDARHGGNAISAKGRELLVQRFSDAECVL